MMIEVRPAKPEEMAEAGQIVLAAYDAGQRVTGDYRQTITDARARARSGADVLVAVHPDARRLLGCVTFTDQGNTSFESPGDGDCGFRMLGVAPEAQGSGAGSALVSACIELARSRERRRIAIHSLDWMIAAHRLYERFGFVRRPDRDVMFPLGPGLAFQLDLVAGAAAHFLPEGPPREGAPPYYEDAWRVRRAEWRAFRRLRGAAAASGGDAASR